MQHAVGSFKCVQLLGKNFPPTISPAEQVCCTSNREMSSKNVGTNMIATYTLDAKPQGGKNFSGPVSWCLLELFTALLGILWKIFGLGWICASSMGYYEKRIRVQGLAWTMLENVVNWQGLSISAKPGCFLWNGSFQNLSSCNTWLPAEIIFSSSHRHAKFPVYSPSLVVQCKYCIWLWVFRFKDQGREMLLKFE